MAYESPVIRPETTTLPPLSNGDTITVKKRLNQGEKRAEQARLYRRLPDGALRIDPLQVGLSMVCAYLLNWTVKGLDGAVIPITETDGRPKPVEAVEAALDLLDPFIYDEIELAIRDHEAAMMAAREALKKTNSGAPPDATTSSSPSGADGASTTSERST